MNERNTFTQKLLIDSGIKENLQILDVGCGTGEVSFLIQELMAGTGEIVGIDINEAAIAGAQKTADEKQLTNVRFMTLPIDTAAEKLGTFDVIVGRRILMYLPDPFQAIKDLANCLKPNGRMIFQESDAAGAGTLAEKFPLHTQAQQWVWETVAHEQGNIHIGSEMYSLFTKAGLTVKDVCAEAVLQTAETGSDLAWLLQMMAGRIIQTGAATKTDLESINEEALLKEMNQAQAVFLRDMNFGICGEK